MKILGDFHTHTHHSGDSQTPMEEMIKQALNKGLRFICFTEHNDFDYPYTHDLEKDCFLLNVSSYLYELLTLREKYQNQIKVLFGIELGLDNAPETVKKNLKLADSYPFDFIIGSSHVCHGQDPYYPEFYVGRSEKEAYREYFESILENINSFSGFNVYGHLDYIVRYGPTTDKNYKYEDYADIFDEILKELINKGKGIEVNTGSFRSGLSTTNPCPAILKRYHELGGSLITIGSDAHSPEYIASQFDMVHDMLTEIGYKYYCVYEKGSPIYLKL